MSAFFTVSSLGRLASGLLTMLVLIATAAALVFVILQNNFRQSRRHLADIFLLAALIADQLVMLHLFSQVQLAALSGYFYINPLAFWRYLVFAAVLIPAAVIIIKRKQPLVLVALAAAVLLLPACEYLPYLSFVQTYVIAMLLLFIYALSQVQAGYKHITSQLSAVSVKQAIDTLTTGIMYYQSDGFIMLINQKMQSLMTAVAGKTYRNGQQFYDLLAEKQDTENSQAIPFGTGFAYQLDDGSIWLFTQSEVTVDNELYLHLAATDVSSQYEMTMKLRQQHQALVQRSDDLKYSIDTMQKVCLQQQTIAMQNRFHDVLGQRVALLLQALRENKEPDEKLFDSFIADLTASNDQISASPKPSEKLLLLQSTLKQVDVSLSYNQGLPENTELADLFVQIISEACTNAVRHGLASEIKVRFKNTAKAYAFAISDNGTAVNNSGHESGGLAAARQKLQAYNGTLVITPLPHFTIDVKVDRDNI